ncbi:hypothetical protein NM208_g8427 [Fusarium decemcellulare]|uniref:Uncharacterized protein n=1 Tax=Fusarium decemcellulare TaxID=57161 RepID=A0ACC1S5D7_9HYPO|nr:hypothetical protein NM208_g8427 [Fusarium decemcellulare]
MFSRHTIQAFVNEHEDEMGSQPIELCFHSSFVAPTLRPLSLHFDDSYLISYRRPPPPVTPRSPGVITNLRRVDVIPDDPESLMLLEQQIQPRWGLVRLVICSVFGFTVLSWLLLAKLGSSASEADSPVHVVPLLSHVSSISLGTTQLCPVFFFNPFVYATIGGAPDLPPSPRETLHRSWNITHKLVWKFLFQHFSDKEFKSFRAFDQDSQDIRETWDRGKIGWVTGMIMSLATTAIRIDLVSTTIEDGLFHLDEGNSSSATGRIPSVKLPEQVPAGIIEMVKSYSSALARNNLVSSACKVLWDRRYPFPNSTPLTQVAHPSYCLGNSSVSVEDRLKHLESWAVLSRDRNLTLDEEQVFTIGSTTKTYLAKKAGEYFWPNQTKFPALFEQPRWLVQLKDAMDQTVEASRIVAGETQSGEMFSWDWLHDMVQGMGLVGDICREFDTLSAFIEELHCISAWVVDENMTQVMIRKLPHPKDQVKQLRSLQQEVRRRPGVLAEYES